VDHERDILLRPQDLIEKAGARIPFLADEAPLAPAGIHEQSQRQWQIALLREVPDRLGTPVLVQQKLLFGQIAHDFALLIAHVREDVHHFDVC
jgi:hypothetical protein